MRDKRFSINLLVSWYKGSLSLGGRWSFCICHFFMHCGSWILIDLVPNSRPQTGHGTDLGLGIADGGVAVSGSCLGSLALQKQRKNL